MLHDVVANPGDHDVDEVYARYQGELADAIETVGVEPVVAETGLTADTVRAIGTADPPEVTLEEAAAVLASLPDAPAGEEIAALARDAVLMGMTNAVMDVETVASVMDGRLEPKEIQSKVEGRYPMTLREFALLHHHIDGHGP